MGGFYTYMAIMDFMNSTKEESFLYCIFILNSLIISDTLAKTGVTARIQMLFGHTIVSSKRY